MERAMCAAEEHTGVGATDKVLTPLCWQVLGVRTVVRHENIGMFGKAVGVLTCEAEDNTGIGAALKASTPKCWGALS